MKLIIGIWGASRPFVLSFADSTYKHAVEGTFIDFFYLKLFQSNC